MNASLHQICRHGNHIETVMMQRKVRKLANALGMALNLRPGNGLVMFLGHGGERDNYQALETWVSHVLEQACLLPTREALPVLMMRLESQLTEWEDLA